MSDASRWAFVPLVLLTAMGAAAVTATLSTRVAVPPATTRTITVRPSPDVLRAVQDLARLETVSFHMERVVDLRETQARAWGLIEAEDAILLVAVGDVVAGVDLSALRPEDVSVSEDHARATVTLPRATVFSARLDNARTYVHSRTTDALARRQEQLESRARQEAERSIAAAAEEAGILARAEQNAQRTITSLVRGMGVRDVSVRWR